jgi:hypothetical protein
VLLHESTCFVIVSTLCIMPKKCVKYHERQQQSCKIESNNFGTIWNYPTLSEHSKYQHACAYTHIRTLSHTWTLHTFLYIVIKCAHMCVCYLPVHRQYSLVQTSSLIEASNVYLTYAELFMKHHRLWTMNPFQYIWHNWWPSHTILVIELKKLWL